MGIQTLGCIGILIEAKKQGLVPAIFPLLDKLEKEAGFWIDDRLRALALTRTGE
jgi:predicted nucleic acid-binding protein